jgi:hypothetical protein
VLLPDRLGEPDEQGGAQAGAVGQQLAQVVVVAGPVLVLDQHLRLLADHPELEVRLEPPDPDLAADQLQRSL